MSSLIQMTKKLGKFPTIVPLEISTSWRFDWKNWNKGTWDIIEERYSDMLQRDLLRALAISGRPQHCWDAVFQKLYNGTDYWGQVNRFWFESKANPNWQHLFALVVSDPDYQISYYPVFEPLWLVEYGYTQIQYIADLAQYWDDISDEYFRPWSSSTVGEGIVAYEQIQHISQETQQDIEQLIQSAKLVLDLSRNGDFYGNQK